MNVLLVADAIFPNTVGGSYRTVYELGRGLIARGHNVVVIIPMPKREAQSGIGTASHPPYKIIGGMKVYEYKVNRNNTILAIISHLVNAKRTFEQILLRERIDIINFHYALNAFGILLSKRARAIRKIYTFHGPWAMEYAMSLKGRLKAKPQLTQRAVAPLINLMTLIMKYIERRVLKASEMIIVHSSYMKNKLVTVHPQMLYKKIEKIPAGVDCEKFRPSDKTKVRRVLAWPEKKFVMFTVRRLDARMGLENLILAIRILAEEFRDIMLIIGGHGPLKLHLETLIADNKLENYVKLIGFIPDDKLPMYYQASDLFILPSIALEGFGLVTLEALACGLPVLATPIGGSKEILSCLDERLLFKGTSPQEMAAKIKDFILNKNMLDSLSCRCRRFVLSNYSWERMVLEMESVMINILKQEGKTHQLHH